LSPKNVLIIGSGTGGTLTANLLSKILKNKIKAGSLKITLVSESNRHYFQPANLDVAFRGADPSRYYRDISSLVKPRIDVVYDRVAQIDLSNRKVKLARRGLVSYDYLVIATGSVAEPEAVPGLAEASLNFHTSPENASKIWRAINRINSGRILVVIAGVPHKCPPSPNEAAFLLDEYFRKRGIREKVEIKFITPYGRAYPAHSVSEVVEELFRRRNIEVVTFFNLESVDHGRRRVYSYEGEEHAYDLLISVPPHFGASVVRSSGIGDREGWIPTDRNDMTVLDYDDVYAIGDATNIPISKSGVVAHLESGVVAYNIASEIDGSGDRYGYNGRINCPMEVGFKKAIFINGTYDSPPTKQDPSLIKYLMKRLFARFYWNVLSGDFEWVFNLYFGETKYLLKTRGPALHEVRREGGEAAETVKEELH
jgi:sulfide:quinone oxidoreductase